MKNKPLLTERSRPLAIPGGRPEFADSQRQRILQLLRLAGTGGVSHSDLIFQHRFTQRGTRIFELERMGYVIRHATKPGQRYVTYYLISEPEHPNPLPTYLKKPLPATPGMLFDLTVDPR